MQRYGVLNGSGSDSGQHLLHWLYMFISWGTIYFPLASIFLFLPHFLSLAKTEESLTLVHFLSPKNVFHTLIRSEKTTTTTTKKTQHSIYWVTLMGMILWQGLSWKWEKQRHLEVEGLCSLGLPEQQSTLNHLIAGEFPSCYLDHSALLSKDTLYAHFASWKAGLNVVSIRQPFMECLS